MAWHFQAKGHHWIWGWTIVTWSIFLRLLRCRCVFGLSLTLGCFATRPAGLKFLLAIAFLGHYRPESSRQRKSEISIWFADQIFHAKAHSMFQVQFLHSPGWVPLEFLLVMSETSLLLTFLQHYFYCRYFVRAKLWSCPGIDIQVTLVLQNLAHIPIPEGLFTWIST